MVAHRAGYLGRIVATFIVFLARAFNNGIHAYTEALLFV